MCLLTSELLRQCQYLSHVRKQKCNFSKLKLIKKYILSTGAQERFIGLAVIPVEHEVVLTIDINEMIQNSAKA